MDQTEPICRPDALEMLASYLTSVVVYVQAWTKPLVGYTLALNVALLICYSPSHSLKHTHTAYGCCFTKLCFLYFLLSWAHTSCIQAGELITHPAFLLSHWQLLVLILCGQLSSFPLNERRDAQHRIGRSRPFWLVTFEDEAWICESVHFFTSKEPKWESRNLSALFKLFCHLQIPYHQSIGTINAAKL